MNRTTNFQTILFDLDGTLIDHFNVLYRCYAHTLRTLGLPEPTYQEVRRAVGGSMENTMRKFVSEEEFDQAAKVFWEFFDKIFLDEVVVFPGVREWLEALSKEGRTLAVITNKQGKASRAICEHAGLDPFLKAVFGANDTEWRKPEPELTRHVLRALDAKPESTCLIGDSPFDIETAANGGFPCYCVTTGTHSAEELKAAGADGVFANFRELRDRHPL